MKKSLKKVTLTLKENVAHWAQTEAARRHISVSRLLDTILKERMSQDQRYEAAMQRMLSCKPFLHSDGEYLSREKLQDRARFR